MSGTILYSYFRSSCSWRVRIALAMKSIEYQTKAVNLLKSNQKDEDYTAINPIQQVPSLSIDGHELTQSIAIIEYLEDTRPAEPYLLPKDPATRAQARALAEIINAGTQPIQNLVVLKYVGDEKKMEWGNYWIAKGLAAFEKALAKTAGKYCVGDNVSIADLCLVPQVYNANRFKVDMSQFPRIMKIHDELEKLEAFQAAHPTKQIDCPDDLK